MRDLGAAGNLVGLPAITVPSGPDGAGLPTALAFVGPAFGEQRVLDVAVAYQQRTAWHNERPAW